MENKTPTRKKPICRSCRTPMKGHLRGQCRPNPWCDHGDNNKLHGGHYEWETERWTGSKWVPLVVTAASLNDTANESEPEESDSESALVAALAALVAPEPENLLVRHQHQKQKQHPKQ